jgi:hypothetical protein
MASRELRPEDYLPQDTVGGLGGLGGFDIGSLLRALGSSLLSSPHNQPFAGVPAAMQLQTKNQQEELDRRLRLAQLKYGMDKDNRSFGLQQASHGLAIKQFNEATRRANVDDTRQQMLADIAVAKANREAAAEAAGGFTGGSVDAQALNALIRAGKMTPQQAAEYAAGKVVTNPEDKSLMYMTPGAIFPQAGAAPPPPAAGVPPSAEPITTPTQVPGTVGASPTARSPAPGAWIGPNRTD